MAKIIPFRERFAGQAEKKLYGECPACGSDEFHILMDEDEDVRGNECKICRSEYLFPAEDCITFELE